MFFLNKDSSQLKPITNLIYLLLLMQTPLKMFLLDIIFCQNIKLWCMSCRRSNYINFVQKQSSRDVLKKRCFEDTRQIYRRTSLLKCDFNKVALQHHWNHTLPQRWFAVNLLNIFRMRFYKNNSGGLLLFVIENLCQ